MTSATVHAHPRLAVPSAVAAGGRATDALLLATVLTVSFAKLQMSADLAMSDAVYGVGAGIFFVGYGLCEIPSNLLLARFGARVWIARIMVTWGLISMAMMFVEGPVSFYVLRFLLGVAEAGFLPGIIYYLGHWFPRLHRARAVSWFMIGIPLSLVFGGLLWPIAWLWAFTRPVAYKAAYGTDKHEEWHETMGEKAKAGELLQHELDHLKGELDQMAARGALSPALKQLRADLAAVAPEQGAKPAAAGGNA